MMECQFCGNTVEPENQNYRRSTYTGEIGTTEYGELVHTGTLALCCTTCATQIDHDHDNATCRKCRGGLSPCCGCDIHAHGCTCA